MTTSVELFRSGSYESIDYSEFEIEVGISTRLVAPKASFRSHVNEPVSAGQGARIRIDGTTIFEGSAQSGGSKRRRGELDVALEHDSAELWASKADVSLTGPPTDEEVLQAAITNAGTNGSFTLDYHGTATTLNNGYDVSNRLVKEIFRDMMDRTGRVWWVDPAGSTVHVEPKGVRGTWKSLDGTNRGVAVQDFDSGSVDTVRNDVTVIGTGEEAVTGSATDATSISNYGKRSVTYNVSYAIAQSEADALASSLLRPDPVPEGEVVLTSNVGNITDTLANYVIDLDDDSKNIDATGLLVETQTIEQNRATLSVGGGIGESVSEHNRDSKSRGDITDPGSVFGNDRLANDSVDTEQLVDTAVIEEKLQDAAVATAKLENNAVINGKLDDLSVSETKIQDDSIATPKLQAEAVTANEIEADTITAAEIAAGTITALEILADTITADEIAADTITALQIAADTLTANEIDTLDLETGDISIGTDADNRIEYTVETINTTDYPVLQPNVDEGADLGFTGNKWRSVLTRDLVAEDVTFSNSTTPLAVQPSGSSVVFQVTEDNGLALVPSVASTGRVGTSTDYWNEMHATDFVTHSPPSWTPADADDVRDWDVGGKDVPEFGRRDGGEDGGDGLSIPRMFSMLVGVCQQQADAIEDLEARIEALE